MTEHLGDDHLARLREGAAQMRATGSAIERSYGLDFENAATELERYRKLGTWDLPQHDGWWLDREGAVHHINVSGLTGERSEWFYRQLGPWREVKDYSQITDDVFETNASSRADGRAEIITEVRSLLDILEGQTA